MRRAMRRAQPYSLACGWCLAWLLAGARRGLGRADLLRHRPGRGIARGRSDAPLYSVGTYDQSLTFYLRRTVTLVGYRGELDYGLRKAPDRGDRGSGRIYCRLDVAVRAFAVMDKSTFNNFQGARRAHA